MDITQSQSQSASLAKEILAGIDKRIAEIKKERLMRYKPEMETRVTQAAETR